VSSRVRGQTQKHEELENDGCARLSEAHDPKHADLWGENKQYQHSQCEDWTLWLSAYHALPPSRAIALWKDLSVSQIKKEKRKKIEFRQKK